MKQEKIARQIDKARKDLEKIIIGLVDVRALRDLPFQTERVEKVKKDLDILSTDIQGSGTGNE